MEATMVEKQGIGKFIVKMGWLIGLIAIATAIMLYSISIQSLAYGLGHADMMENATDTSLLFAWAINLLEIVGVCWIIAKELRVGEETREDLALNAVINIAMIVVLVGDFAAILYASGAFSNLPGDWFGKILAGTLRVIKSVIGAAGSETLILLGLYLIIEWFKQYAYSTHPAQPSRQPTRPVSPVSGIHPVYPTPTRPAQSFGHVNRPASRPNTGLRPNAIPLAGEDEQ